MMRIEPNVVLKYFEPIDAFVRIRRFTDVEVQSLLRDVRITTRRSYIDLVLNACVMHFAEAILPALPDSSISYEQLYELCVDVSPALDIRRISIPVEEASAPTIHLLEVQQKTPTAGFRHLLGMETELARRVIGQPHAINSVSRAVKKAMTGLRDPQRPIATFLFVGQTGVGKTELAKALTLYLYNDVARMIRIDCSEYALPHEYAKLIGAPPGYVGHEQAGVLSDAISQQQEAVVLFDEIEKSDAKVHDLLLQLMDEGCITDNKAHRVPFGKAIVILTSNVGAQEIDAMRHRMGFGTDRRPPTQDQLLEEMSNALRGRFRPEFVNRITEVVLFNPVGLKECIEIASLMLEDVKRHAANVPLTLHIGSTVPHFLAKKGYQPECGAREIRRTVEQEVEGRLSDLLIEGKVREGDTVDIRVHRDHLVFHRN